MSDDRDMSDGTFGLIVVVSILFGALGWFSGRSFAMDDLRERVERLERLERRACP